jgi:predicted small lipoprotein YifL
MRLETIWIALLTVALALGVSACGTRSSLENPASDDRTATADSGQGKKEGDAPKPHRGFVLDGLIR